MDFLPNPPLILIGDWRRHVHEDEEQRVMMAQILTTVRVLMLEWHRTWGLVVVVVGIHIHNTGVKQDRTLRLVFCNRKDS